MTSRDVFRAKGALRRLTLSAIIYPHIGCALSSHSICTLTPSCHLGAVVFARSRPFSFLSFKKKARMEADMEFGPVRKVLLSYPKVLLSYP